MTKKKGVDIYFNITESPIDSRHICYFTEMKYDKNGKEIVILKQIVERTYRHPQAKDIATISQYEMEIIETPDINQVNAAIKLLDHAQINIQNII